MAHLKQLVSTIIKKLTSLFPNHLLAKLELKRAKKELGMTLI